MKFIINSNQHTAINLANVSEITISCNYLKLTTTGGLNAREVSFFYGSDAVLEMLFAKIMEFVDSTESVFDCYKFVNTL